MMGQTAVRWLRAGALLLASCATASAIAQTGTMISRPVVQSTGTAQLNEALARLSANPQDVEALLDASNAALQLGDVEAAIGFLKRADLINPRNARVKTLMGSALLRNENPYDAIGYFDQAEAAGADAARIAGDRGLAFDLVGAQSAAQAFYKIAMATAPSEEVTRRYALSLAVSGDRRTADAVLSPLIQRQDPAAWRTRTFILAISGQQEEAISVANSMMPKQLADGIAPYLRYMPRLTAAQQIAAATFGKFPRAADIGRDDPRAARFAQIAPPRVPVTETPPALAVVTSTSGKDGSGKKDRKKSREQVRVVAVPAPVSQQPAVVTPPAANAQAAVSLATAPHAGVSQEGGTLSANPAPTSLASGASPVSGGSPVSAYRPSVSIPVVQSLPQAPVEAPAPVVRQAAAPLDEPPAEAMDFSAAFGDFRPPVEEKSTSVAAVDITRITPARALPKPAAPDVAPPTKVTTASNTTPARTSESASTRTSRGARPDGPSDVSRTPAASAKAADRSTARATTDRVTSRTQAGDAAKADAAKGSKADSRGKKAKEPANPSRIWVQLSTGGNREALPQDWRRLQRAAPDVLRGKRPYITAWRSNFRLLTGPFESEAAARAFVNQLRRADVSSFSWTSDAGQAVDPLSTGR